MFELEGFRDRLSNRGLRLLEEAIEESRRRQHYYLGVEHIFISFTKVEKVFFYEIMSDLNVDANQVINFLNDHLTASRQYVGVGLQVHPSTKTIFKLAWEEAQRWGRNLIDSTDLFIAIFQESQSLPVKIFKSFGLAPDFIMRRVAVKIRTKEEFEEELRRKYELPANLKHFAVNLNKLARFEKLPPIIGREEEIDRVLEILCHVERSNSVMIVGEPGVGKTAVVEGLARRLELEPQSIPKRLRNKQVINLQMNTIVAGTIFRGMFEDRVEKIIKEIKESRNFILFIDEAHTIIGAGSAMGVPSDAANIFKSTLARGEVQIIGATTLNEYKEYIAEDEALARRFRVVCVDEPDISDTKKILYGLRPRLEGNYSVEITDEAIETSLDMSHRYMRSLRLPDKPISWLDTASVKVEINKDEKKVEPEDIIEVISQETNIPRDMICRDTSERFESMEDALRGRVVGQEEAVSSLASRLRLNKGPLKENYQRPDGVLLFLGPTGVGKTELAKALAEFFFGSDDKMIRLDMSEYKEAGLGVDKLIGMPRGIVGSERGGILTNKVRENPYSVVLLDEIEKANPSVVNLFLQVFDEGWLTDGRGKRVYFSDSVIIMTSNLGVDEFKKFTQPLGFLSKDAEFSSFRKNVLKEVEGTFSPEFLNRIDDIIIFSPLTYDEVREIARMYMGQIMKSIELYGKTLEVTDKAIDIIAKEGYSIKYGARFLKRKIDELVKVPITLNWKEGNAFKLTGARGKIELSWKS